MKILEKFKGVKWINILFFYVLAYGLSYISIQLPNLIKKISIYIFDINISFNFNYGIALFLSSVIAYKIFKIEKKITFLGNNPLFSIIFSSIFLIAYTVLGFSNDFGINVHFWAFLFCFLTLVYDIFEESAWRGFLNDSLKSIPAWIKGIISGVLWSLWHLIIFDNFDSFGGFHIFILMSIIVSILMVYVTNMTKSVLVAASIHALLILRDLNVTIICIIIWTIMLIFWKNSTLKIINKEQ